MCVHVQKDQSITTSQSSWQVGTQDNRKDTWIFFILFLTFHKTSVVVGGFRQKIDNMPCVSFWIPDYENERLPPPVPGGHL